MSTLDTPPVSHQILLCSETMLCLKHAQNCAPSCPAYHDPGSYKDAVMCELATVGEAANKQAAQLDACNQQSHYVQGSNLCPRKQQGLHMLPVSFHGIWLARTITTRYGCRWLTRTVG